MKIDLYMVQGAFQRKTYVHGYATYLNIGARNTQTSLMWTVNRNAFKIQCKVPAVTINPG